MNRRRSTVRAGEPGTQPQPGCQPRRIWPCHCPRSSTYPVSAGCCQRTEWQGRRVPQDRGHKDLRLPTPGALTPLGRPALLAEEQKRVTVGAVPQGAPIFWLSWRRILLPFGDPSQPAKSWTVNMSQGGQPAAATGAKNHLPQAVNSMCSWLRGPLGLEPVLCRPVLEGHWQTRERPGSLQLLLSQGGTKSLWGEGQGDRKARGRRSERWKPLLQTHS